MAISLAPAFETQFFSSFAMKLDAKERVALGALLPRALVAHLYQNAGIEFAPSTLAPDQKRFAAQLNAQAAKAPNSQTNENIYVIMKSTRLCNLRCAYCNSWRSGPGQKMSFETLARATIGALQVQSTKQVDFVWHGGEATLLPIQFYENALWLQRHYNGRGVIVKNSIQTNAVQLSDEWIDFLAKHDFGVGVSIDGPPELHDRFRRDIRGIETSRRIEKNIAKLLSAKINIGFLLVVTPDTIRLGAESLLRWLHDTGVPFLSVLNSIPDNATSNSCPDHYLAFDDYVHFLCDLVDVWYREYRNKIAIREVQSLINNLRTKTPILCVHKGRCMGQFLTIDPNGDVSACDKYINDADLKFGSLASNSLAEIIAHSQKLMAARAVADSRSDAYEHSCAFGTVCRGGCPHDAYLLERFGADGARGCCGLAPLIRKLTDLGFQDPKLN